MKFRDDWPKILKHAWSVRLIAIAAVLSGAEIALPIVGDYLPISKLLLSLLVFLVVAAALVARVVVQEEFGAS